MTVSSSMNSVEEISKCGYCWYGYLHNNKAHIFEKYDYNTNKYESKCHECHREWQGTYIMERLV